MIRLSGRQVVYLGSNVPLASLTQAIRTIQPEYLLFFVIRNDATDTSENYGRQLARSFTGKKIYVAGDSQLVSQIHIDEKIQQLRTAEDLEKVLT